MGDREDTYNVVRTAGSLVVTQLGGAARGVCGMRVSIVVPVADEAPTLVRVIEELYAVTPVDVLGEVIIADDASTDDTPSIVRTLISRPGLRRLRYLRHEARTGRSIAIHSGAAAARFPIIATFDGDGQNDPADIERLAARVALTNAPGPALVCGVRTRRRDTTARIVLSTAGDRLRGLLLRDGCRDAGCGIRAFQQVPYLRMPLFSRQHLYLPALFKAAGFEIADLAVNDRPRLTGISKRSVLGDIAATLPDLAAVLWLTRSEPAKLTEIWPDGGVERDPVRAHEKAP